MGMTFFLHSTLNSRLSLLNLRPLQIFQIRVKGLPGCTKLSYAICFKEV